MVKARKLFAILAAGDRAWLSALRLGVAASVENEVVLRHLECRTVIDIGANRGQFALVARQCFPQATIFSFEPLPETAAQFRKVFARDDATVLHVVAVGPKSEQCAMHVSGRDDSSSLMAITPLQAQIFPGTEEVSTQTVQVGPLSQFLSSQDIASPALLKVDVQGYELQTLKGCAELLEHFTYVYVECSFVELYAGQALANEVILFLQDIGFMLKGIYNMTYDQHGNAIQGDFLFTSHVEQDD